MHRMSDDILRLRPQNAELGAQSRGLDAEKRVLRMQSSVFKMQGLLLRESIKQHSRRFSEVLKLYGSAHFWGVPSLKLLLFLLLSAV